jgi:ribonucleoside-diphosphate reductase alpha chain
MTVTLALTPNALKVLERRYLAKDHSGRVCELPDQMVQRVAETVAHADLLYDMGQRVDDTAEVFHRAIAALDFLPNSPTLMNAGTSLGQLSACFVLPVGDDMNSIFDAVKGTALIHRSGGGTGFSFSRLRPAGDIVGSTGGIASGPISFMRVFDTATDVIKQGGRRRGANMGILRVDHPDIMGFISCKRTEGVFANFNISVAVTNAFMEALQSGGDYDLVNPRNGDVVGRLNAREVFDEIVQHAWSNGEPGIIFIDRINEHNPTPHLGAIESTNPCGEQPLLPNESCNLGSINLARMVRYGGGIDWDHLRDTVRIAVHFLDNVITINRFPLVQIEEATLKTRKIGLGVMGFADMLVRLGVPYDSDEALAVGEKIMEAIAYWSHAMSAELARERGSFPAFKDSLLARGRLPFNAQPSRLATAPLVLADAPAFDWPALSHAIAERGIRNATTTTIAPTGTISIIASVSSGIEPVFALAYTRKNVLDADELPEVNPLFEKAARREGFYSPALVRRIALTGSVQGDENVPDEFQRIFGTAHDISGEWHIRMQAAFQRWTDNAVSKTINFSHVAAPKDIEEAYLLAYRLGCKGLTIYRDGSREAQVLNVGAQAHAPASPVPTGVSRAPRPRPDITSGTTEKVSLGCGRNLYVTVNEDPSGLCEVFIQMGKSGGCTASQSEAIGRLVSLSLRSGIDASEVYNQLKGIRCPSPAWHNGSSILSCADAIGKALERYVGVLTSGESNPHIKSLLDVSPECPECGAILEPAEGCVVCRSCGYSQCT